MVEKLAFFMYKLSFVVIPIEKPGLYSIKKNDKMAKLEKASNNAFDEN